MSLEDFRKCRWENYVGFWAVLALVGATLVFGLWLAERSQSIIGLPLPFVR